VGVRAVRLAVVIEEGDQLRVEGDIAVIVQFADRDPEPIAVADAGDGIGLELAQLAHTHPRAGQQFDCDPTGNTRLGGQSTHEPCEVGVVEEAGQGFGAARDVTEKDRDFGRRVKPVPLGDADEEHTQHPEPAPERRLPQRRPTPARLGVLPQFERLDMRPVDIGHTGQSGVVAHQEPGENP
jgi:hypothetical protein